MLEVLPTLKKRLSEHNNGRNIYTRNKRPWMLMYYEEYPTRSEALQCEKYFKSVEGRLKLKEKGVL